MDLASSSTRGKGLCFRLLACILLPLVHLLLEGPRLLLVDKRQSGQTLFEFEGMEKGSILIVLKGVVDLLIPYHTPIRGGDIHQFDPKGVSDKIIAKDGGAL